MKKPALKTMINSRLPTFDGGKVALALAQALLLYDNVVVDLVAFLFGDGRQLLLAHNLTQNRCPRAINIAVYG